MLFSNKLKDNKFIICLFILAALSRFYRIDIESIWLDEGTTIRLASLSFKNLLAACYYWEANPFFYYFLLHHWINIFGTSEFALRSLSAIFGVMIIISTYYIGKKLVSRNVGILASLLVLISPLNLWFSQETRMYAFQSLLTLLSSYLFYSMLSSEKSNKNRWLYIVSSVFLIYTHYIGTIVLGVHFCYGLYYVCSQERKKFKLLLSTFIIIFIFYCPWLPVFYQKISPGGIQHHIQPPTLQQGGEAFSILSGIKIPYFVGTGTHITYNLSSLTYSLIGLTLILYTLILFTGIITSFIAKKPFFLFITAICSTPLVIFLISKSIVPCFNTMQVSSFVPIFALMIAMTIHYTPSLWPLKKITILKKLCMFAIIMIAAFNIYNTFLIYRLNTKEDWRAAASYVESRAQENDIVFLNAPYIFSSFCYYYSRDTKITGIGKNSDFDEIYSKYNRIWLIQAYHLKVDPKGKIKQRLNTEYNKLSEKNFTKKIDITLYQK